MPHTLPAMSNSRKTPPARNGPPNGPGAFLVSTTRHGVTGTNRLGTGGVPTIRFVVAVLETPFASVPVIVNWKVPGTAPAVAVTVRVEEAVAGLVLKEELVLLGKPDTLRVAAPV